MSTCRQTVDYYFLSDSLTIGICQARLVGSMNGIWKLLLHISSMENPGHPMDRARHHAHQLLRTLPEVVTATGPSWQLREMVQVRGIVGSRNLLEI
jgi:hypothetical protein